MGNKEKNRTKRTSQLFNSPPTCTTGNQRAKKVVSDSPGLVDFAIGLVNSVVNLPDGQVNFFEEFKLQKNCEINLLIKTFFGLVEMIFGVVYVSFSLPEWQAVKMTFFAPWLMHIPCKEKVKALTINASQLFFSLSFERGGSDRITSSSVSQLATNSMVMKLKTNWRWRNDSNSIQYIHGDVRFENITITTFFFSLLCSFLLSFWTSTASSIQK